MVSLDVLDGAVVVRVLGTVTLVIGPGVIGGVKVGFSSLSVDDVSIIVLIIIFVEIVNQILILILLIILRI